MAPVKKMAAWEDIVLRVIAIYKILHGLFFIVVGVGLIRLKHANLPQVLNDYVIQPMNFSPENKWVDWALDQADKVTPHQFQLAGDFSLVYAMLFLAEGIGLYLRKQWAEYVVIIITGSLLPVEIWTMIQKAELWKVGLIVGNLLIVGYLIHRLRLDYTRRRERAEGEPGIQASSGTPEKQPVRNAH